MTESEQGLTELIMQHVPRVGDQLWFHVDRDLSVKLTDKFKTTTFEVVRVAHWIAKAYKSDEAIQSCAIYVKPML